MTHLLEDSSKSTEVAVPVIHSEVVVLPGLSDSTRSSNSTRNALKLMSAPTEQSTVVRPANGRSLPFIYPDGFLFSDQDGWRASGRDRNRVRDGLFAAFRRRARFERLD